MMRSDLEDLKGTDQIFSDILYFRAFRLCGESAMKRHLGRKHCHDILDGNYKWRYDMSDDYIYPATSDPMYRMRGVSLTRKV